MKLYVLELSIFFRSPHETKERTIAKVPVTLEALWLTSDDGDWSVRKSDENYFGQTSGWWTNKTSDGGEKQIWLMNDEDPNMISWLWRDVPTLVVMIEGVLKLPLFLGETGTGLIMPVNKTSYRIGWKVINRGF